VVRGHPDEAGGTVSAGDGQERERPGAPFTDDAAAAAWARDADPREFFGRGAGLLAMNLGAAVMTMGPLARGIDGRIWRYSRGVYVPDNGAVRARAVALLKDAYRPGHAAVAEDVVLAHAPVIDSEPCEHLVNVPNGLLDWRTGMLYAHDPGVLSTVQLGAPWDPAARCPAFDWWLAQVVPHDCIELAWELTGYLAYSGNPLHAAVMLTGTGRNGKGTYLRLMKAMLGKANVTAVSLADLVTNRFAKATLFGRIANIAGDIDATFLESTAVLKAVTGGDLVSAEHKGKDLFDFTPWAVPVFSANAVPPSADTTAGYLSRWLIIPFPVSFAGREDRTIEARLHAELPGILAGGLRRLPALLARGQFGLTDSAREAKAEFERRTDQVKYWLDECCERGDYPPANRAALYQAYKRWTDRDSGKPVKAAEFYDRLARCGIPQGRAGDSGTRVFYGVKVTDSGFPAAVMPSRY
jgi:P4 family phage/plasmid primase-like protien